MNKERIKIVLIGAGSAQFGFSTLGDLFQSKILKQRKVHILLHDINATTLAEVLGAGHRFIAINRLPFDISATTSRQEALRDADFCIISIETGNRFELWEQDWRIPQQFGFRQVYGENGGPGGLFHSLRIIRPILDICEDIVHLCPDAFVFNFSNPMSRICTAVHMKFPQVKFIGLCHEIASLKKHLPLLLDTPPENIHFRAAGLNHFSVLLEVRRKDTGEDAYTEVLEKAPAYFETYLAPFVSNNLPRQRPEGWQPHWHERGVFRTMLEKYRLLPITTDSHFGEYPAWAYDVADHEGILDFYEAYKNYVMQSKPQIELKLTERVVPIIEGILEDLGFEESAVNIPNDGFIADLPSFLAVEVPAMIDKNGVHGIAVGELIPPGFLGMLYNQVAIHRLTAEAVIQCSREIALQALLADPTVDKVGAAERLLNHMLEVQEDYLSYLT